MIPYPTSRLQMIPQRPLFITTRLWVGLYAYYIHIHTISHAPATYIHAYIAITFHDYTACYLRLFPATTYVLALACLCICIGMVASMIMHTYLLIICMHTFIMQSYIYKPLSYLKLCICSWISYIYSMSHSCSWYGHPWFCIIIVRSTLQGVCKAQN